MTHPIARIALAAAAALIATTSVHAQTAVNGPYYATPSWDQTLPASSRFLVLANYESQAVLDRETGVVWMRSPMPGRLPFGNAESACLNASLADRAGWRLPTIHELTSVFSPRPTTLPPFASGHPFTGFPPFASFWSSTRSSRNLPYTATYDSTPSFGPYVNLAIEAEATVQATAWCVRAP